MHEFKWIDTHTYPDYNVILTKKYVKAMCLQRDTVPYPDALDLLRRLLAPQRDFFIEETCSDVKGKDKRRMAYKDVHAVMVRFFPDFTQILQKLSFDHKIIKLFMWENGWRSYVYFPDSNDRREKIEGAGFRKIYPNFYFMERFI